MDAKELSPAVLDATFAAMLRFGFAGSVEELRAHIAALAARAERDRDNARDAALEEVSDLMRRRGEVAERQGDKVIAAILEEVGKDIAFLKSAPARRFVDAEEAAAVLRFLLPLIGLEAHNAARARLGLEREP